MKCAFTLLRVFLLSLAAIAPGCAASDAAPSAAGGADQAAKVVLRDVPPPPGLTDTRLAPYARPAADATTSSDPYTRARMTLEEILSRTTPPDYLTPAPDPASDAAADKPDLAAQRAYAAGRAAMYRGDRTAAARHLERALSMAPRRAEILRVLGHLYTEARNRARGAIYLRDAVRLDPTDAESLIALGQYELEQRNDGRAIAVFAHVLAMDLDGDSIDPALPILARFYLAGALDREGHEAAAIKQVRMYLDRPGSIGRSTRMYRELYILDRQRGDMWLRLGDAYHRLDDPLAARDAYRQALILGAGSDSDMLRRRIYTLLRLSQADEATDILLRRLRDAKSVEADLELAQYVADHGGDDQRIADALYAIYLERQRDPVLLLKLVGALNDARARSLLAEHLAARPGDRAVYHELLTLDTAGWRDQPARLAGAVRTTADAIHTNPDQMAELVVTLSVAVDDDDALRAAVDKQAAAGTDGAVHVIAALLHLRHDELDNAVTALRQAAEFAPDLVPARVLLIKALLDRDELDEAERLIDDLALTHAAAAAVPRVRLLKARNRHDEARALLEELVRDRPGDADLVLELVAMEQAPRDQEALLVEALTHAPTAERVYDALYELYLADAQQPQPQLGDSASKRESLMARMTQHIPHSTVTRYRKAQRHLLENQPRLAEPLIRKLIEDDGSQVRQHELLVLVLWRTGQRDDARQAVERMLSEFPRQPEALEFAAAFYEVVGPEQRWLEILEQVLLSKPPSAVRDHQLARLYVQTDRPERAVELLKALLDHPDVNVLVALNDLSHVLHDMDQNDEALRIFDQVIARVVPDKPRLEGELLYRRSHILSRLNRMDEYKAALEAAYKVAPDHDGINNDLGYLLADEGRDLDRAIRMVQHANDAQPGVAPYTDSLGWAHYKLGNFEQAVEFLRQAAGLDGGEHPVILDHLGDAYYRVGQKERAIVAWRKAREQVDRMPKDQWANDREMTDLDARLTHKLGAIDDGREPEPAPVGEGVVIEKPEAGEPDADDAQPEPEADAQPAQTPDAVVPQPPTVAPDPILPAAP